MPRRRPSQGYFEECRSSVSLLRPRTTKLTYIYDFGDGWEHRLTLSKPRAADPNLAYPRYITGEHAAPPEDCGGIPGFYTQLEILGDPNHPDHEDVEDWLATTIQIASTNSPSRTSSLASQTVAEQRPLGPSSGNQLTLTALLLLALSIRWHPAFYCLPDNDLRFGQFFGIGGDRTASAAIFNRDEVEKIRSVVINAGRIFIDNTCDNNRTNDFEVVRQFCGSFNNVLIGNIGAPSHGRRGSNSREHRNSYIVNGLIGAHPVVPG